ncbi:MAG TPA: ATP phosphoribosyltransferase regulatory subunit, partial [Rhodospirillales bacterium]|nr:ATP phosphoribosyltransferase regulatory subunit [Rhodospirillales bacterium]
MNKNRAEKDLLPAGMSDGLPPYAGFEAHVSEALMAGFSRRGYERVKPPLIEFEDSLLSGNGAAMASRAFRLMDPVSEKMLGIRPDMTPQVSRIATTRLEKAPRPLRLSYTGQVLRVKGSQLSPERQFGQAGAELIGARGPKADAEVIVMAAIALKALGINGLSVDLCLPRLVPAITAPLPLDEETQDMLRRALDRKNATDLSVLKEKLGPAFAPLSALLTAGGTAGEALEKLAAIDLPADARAACSRLKDVIDLIGDDAPDLLITVDPVENRGFEYHTGVTFAFFAKGVRGELGRGGRYLAGNGEPATGVSLFMDSVLRALPTPNNTGRRLFLPSETDEETARRLRHEGWITVMDLNKT